MKSCGLPQQGAAPGAAMVTRQPRWRPFWSYPHWPGRSCMDAMQQPSLLTCRRTQTTHKMHAVASWSLNPKVLGMNCVNAWTNSGGIHQEPSISFVWNTSVCVCSEVLFPNCLAPQSTCISWEVLVSYCPSPQFTCVCSEVLCPDCLAPQSTCIPWEVLFSGCLAPQSTCVCSEVLFTACLSPQSTCVSWEVLFPV